MPIAPKNLNQNNSGYGYKQAQYTWREGSLSTLSDISDYYTNGGYDRVRCFQCLERREECPLNV